MAIVPLSKVTFYGPIGQKEEILDGLQSLGCLHLLSLRPDADQKRGGPAISVEMQEALRYLAACPVQRRPARSERLDPARLAAQVLEIRAREQELRDERDELLKEIERQKPWGEFYLPPPEEVGGLQFWFYIVPHYRMRIVRSLDLVWEVVARDQRFQYVAVISPDEPRGMPVPAVDLDPRSLTELTQRLETVEDELEELNWRRVAMTRFAWVLETTLAAAADRDEREHAARRTWDADRLFALQGWAPEPLRPRLEEFADEHVLAMTVEAPRPDEHPPTLLHNPELLAGGEEAVRFYMTPGYRTWDPSLVVFFSFSFFFAMILADAGYALLLVAAVFFLWKKLGSSQEGRRVRRLGIALGIVSLVYGMLAGAYFGLSPAPGTLLARAHILDSRDLSVMMPLSIIIGALHVCLAIGITAWQQRGSPRILASFGWAAMVFGGLGVGFGLTETGPENFQDKLIPGGLTVLAVGAGLVLLFSSARAVRRPLDLFWRTLDGLHALTNITQAFGDVLSYLRLFALGLASTQLAFTFNELAQQASGHPALGVLLGALVFVIGHTFNFVLSTLSGVVHGLRLNCIEFFKWGLPEEGQPFRPFSKKAEV